MNLAAKDPLILDLTTQDPTTEESTPLQKTATKIFVDNQGAMGLTYNPEFHARTKHLVIHEEYIWEKVTTGEIELEYLHTGDMITKCLTKNLSRDKPNRIWDKMGLH